MTIPQPPGLRIAPLEQGDPLLEEWEIAQRNAAYFDENAVKLWRLHEGKELLIYGDGTVEAFEDVAQLVQRLSELDNHTRASAIHRWQRPQGAWLL